MDLWVARDPPESPAEGVVLDPTAPGACRDSLDPRETEGSMAWPDFPVKKDTEVNLDLLDLMVAPERTEKGEMTERSGPGDSLVNQGLVVCWDRKDLRDPQDPPA